MLCSSPGFQLDHDISNVVIVTGKASKKINTEGARGPLDIDRDGMDMTALSFNSFNLFQEVVDCEDFVFRTSNCSGPNCSNVF